MEPFLIGFVVFSLFVVAGVFIMADINHNYAGIIDSNLSTSEFNDTYNTIDEMYNISQDQADQVFGSEVSEDNVIDTSYKGVFSAIRLVRNTFRLLGNIMNDVAYTIGVPSFFIKFALAALTIAVLFGIITIVLRFRE